jgi:glycosyltransferase involved in cell wall biosynthesis
MKIALVEPVGGHGGMDYYDYGLAYGLGNNETEVLYYTCDKTRVRDFKNVNTILIFQKVWGTNFVIKVYQYLKGHFLAFRDAKEKGADIVHLHFFTFRIIDCLVLTLAKKMKLTTVATVHDVNAFDREASIAVEKKCYNLMDGVIVHNISSRKDLEKKNASIKKMAVIPHGNYSPFIKKLSEKHSNEVFTLLFFGQIKQVKGLDILLKAVKLVVDNGHKLKLIIAGKAWKSNLDYYIDMIDNLQIKDMVETDFRYIPDEEVATFYSMANLVVLPYTEIYQSGVLLLSMSYGRTVLCSDLSAFKEIIIDHETGFLFQNKNEQDLANKIIYIIENRTILSNIVENANTLIESQYDWINIGKQTLNFYNSLHI